MAVEHYEYVLEENIIKDDNIFFKPFEETFNFVMFSMIVGMIYPNPATVKWRILAIIVFILLIVPVTSALIWDGYISYGEGDIDSIFRHTIVMGPFISQYLKMVLMLIYRKRAKELLEEMNEYFATLNSRPLSHKHIANKWLKKSILIEKSWSYCVLTASFSFPIMAICKNTYSALFDEEPVKYFIHKVRSPFGSTMDFPFYVIIFINTIICSGMYFLNFTGYDGFFVQLILHAAMRLDVCGETLKDAFGIDKNMLRRSAMNEVIKEHIAICKFVDGINEIFKDWLTTITSALVIHLCSCVFFLSKEGNASEETEFVAASLAAISYTFLICFCGELIQDESEKLADTFYQCGWERIPDNHCRYLLVFMIARAQKNLQVQIMTMYNLNLELFVKVVKMAYSLFTFLRQT